MKANLVETLLREANEIVAIMTGSRIATYRKQFLDQQSLGRPVLKSQIKNQKSKML